jgi:hypothetical protein
MHPREIVQRWQAHYSLRKTVEEHWQLIERFVCPGRGKFFQEEKSEHELTWRRRELYDSTAPMAAQSLAASIHGALTSPATKWFRLRFRTDDLNKMKEAKEWLEECEDRVFMALQDSNFNIEAAEAYMDLVCFGTTVLVEETESEDTWEGVQFQVIHIRGCYFDMDWNRDVRNLYREMDMTAGQIVSKFGDDTPAKIRTAYDSAAEIDRKYTVLFCIFRREDKKKADTSKPLAVTERPYGWRYVMADDATPIGEEGGYYEMPAFVARWRMMSGSQWGFSPAMLALPDILTLNELVNLILRAAEKVLDPVTLTTQRGVMGDLDMEPGGVVVVQDINDVKPYESGARFDVSELQRDTLQRSIRTTFHVDQLELKESPAMTATEVNVRYELMQRLLGPTLGRLQNDFLDPLVSRTFKILMRAGQLPEVPEALRDAGGEMDIEYTGPLARAQRMTEADSMNRWVSNLAPLAQLKPDILDNVDFDQFARELGETLGVPATNMRSEIEIKRLRKAREEAMAKTRMTQQATGDGQAMEAMGKGKAALNEGFGEEGANQLLEQVGKQMGGGGGEAA